MRSERLTNAVWQLETGYLAAVTSDHDLMKRIKRYYSGKFRVMAEYYDGGKLVAVQYKVPVRYKRTVERLFREAKKSA